jgi:hypothetical protein
VGIRQNIGRVELQDVVFVGLELLGQTSGHKIVDIAWY